MRRRMVDLWFLVGSSPFFFLGAVQGKRNRSAHFFFARRPPTFSSLALETVKKKIKQLEPEGFIFSNRFHLWLRWVN